jgi:hypothetical protein
MVVVENACKRERQDGRSCAIAHLKAGFRRPRDVKQAAWADLMIMGI